MTGSTGWLHAVAAAWFAGGDGSDLARTTQSLILALTAIAVAWPRLDRHRATRCLGLGAHWVVLALAVLLLRLPVVLTGEINPDESQELSEAITLLRDPSYWHSTDGHTHGPLAPLALVALHATGLDLDYATARLFPVVTIVLAAAAAFAVCRRFLSTQAALLASAVTAIALGSIGVPDMQAFNAEYVGLFLAAAWVFPALRLASEQTRARRWGTIVTAGGLIGLLPFAKLQFGPLAVLLAAITAALLVSTSRGRARWSGVLSLAAAAAGVPVAALAMVWATGGWSHFLVCYIGDNLEYMDMVRWAPGAWAEFAGTMVPALGPSALSVAMATGVGYAVARNDPGRRLPPPVWLATAAFVLVALYSAYRPGRAFPHYLNVAMFPAAIALAFSAAQAVAATRWPHLLAGATLALVAWTPLVTLKGAAPAAVSAQSSSVDAQVAHAIHRWSGPDDAIAVWGWMSRYYVLTQRSSATRHTISEHEIRPGPYRARFRETYMEDLAAREPKVFVDAVAPASFGYTERSQAGHETFPELAEFVGDRYRLVAEVDGVRVFVRHDVLDAAAKAAAAPPQTSAPPTSDLAARRPPVPSGIPGPGRSRRPTD